MSTNKRDEYENFQDCQFLMRQQSQGASSTTSSFPRPSFDAPPSSNPTLYFLDDLPASGYVSPADFDGMLSGKNKAVCFASRILDPLTGALIDSTARNPNNKIKDDERFSRIESESPPPKEINPQSIGRSRLPSPTSSEARSPTPVRRPPTPQPGPRSPSPPSRLPASTASTFCGKKARRTSLPTTAATKAPSGKASKALKRSRSANQISSQVSAASAKACQVAVALDAPRLTRSSSRQELRIVAPSRKRSRVEDVSPSSPPPKRKLAKLRDNQATSLGRGDPPQRSTSRTNINENAPLSQPSSSTIKTSCMPVSTSAVCSTEEPTRRASSRLKSKRATSSQKTV
ncbi:hypothetical protein MJO28_014200 [Puccinia striiformis f. sp. tritici]|uniref:Uncharacterized protein n=1 Tax=Puccinia striiformis f. sp. tritici TaxID=168172 RepID=A0ACC0DU39_9BASI|nr:hypothetical protein Pst134EA_026669 [Puccinia striiformis f. sp. tritici]KAH9449956.1 hypothetical protein Pst134EA_026669 [Puccinia striiformis f. sp. tritici]KAI7938621.1 hypothetical protein MJO28_014200 [Puccinia striiformis f. sp. tritici]